MGQYRFAQWFPYLHDHHRHAEGNLRFSFDLPEFSS
jgi:hypothetical protein